MPITPFQLKIVVCLAERGPKLARYSHRFEKLFRACLPTKLNQFRHGEDISQQTETGYYRFPPAISSAYSQA